ncbi:hypothetical protein ACDP63_07690 [Paracoccus sp. P2]|uniref:Uncharacterized protein n=1 Tax=Paracoccus pantotrophus TaxID=82367 RepID=A0A495P684_PARPN|nr:hypothetical protein [Paracoccus pantotrophus]QFG35522.1 hypothetical protein ESD82_04925 [Paracoccus pantotrophus]QLH13769.1 hypothetical protein HYQ43_05765 [Paracoccus pantotrophus]RKS44249.1 hypothetical protein BDE18_3092 [Paracoccus pantotrophus]
MTQSDHSDDPCNRRKPAGKRQGKPGDEAPFVERMRRKALSRAQDEADMASGRISRQQMQQINSAGLGRILRNARIGRRGRSDGDKRM